MKKTLVSLAVLASSAFSASVFAGDFPMSQVRIQANSNDQSANFASSGVFAGGVNESRNSFGIFTGVKYNKHLGVEIGYTDLGKVFGTSPVSATQRGEFSAYAVPLRLVAEYAVTPAIKLSGKLGIAYVDGEYSDSAGSFDRNSTRATYGLGVSYALAPKVDLALNVDRYELREAGLDNNTIQTGVGINYSF